MAITNCRMLNNVRFPGNLTYLQALETLYQELISDMAPKSGSTKCSHSSISDIDLNNHYLIHADDKRDCSDRSYRSSIRKQSNFKCKQCDIFLCVDLCFYNYYKY